MNFIYVLMLFGSISASSFITSSFFLYGSNGWRAGIVVGIIALIATTITLIATLFRTMEFKNDGRRYCNRIKEHLRDLKSIKREMSEYKEEISDSLTKLYPDYEKEMFKNMTPNDVENISALIVKYPELKFNGILEKYTKRLSLYIEEIHKKDRAINDCLCSLENTESSGWMLGTIQKPEFVQKLINMEFE